MTTSYGKNMKWTVGAPHREALRAAFEQGLRISRHSADGDVDIYGLPNDSWIAIVYVPAAEALTEDQLRKAPWLELLVDEVEPAAERLVGLGVTKVPYKATTHPYFQLPGGPVLRLAKR